MGSRDLRCVREYLMDANTTHRGQSSEQPKVLNGHDPSDLHGIISDIRLNPAVVPQHFLPHGPVSGETILPMNVAAGLYRSRA